MISKLKEYVSCYKSLSDFELMGGDVSSIVDVGYSRKSEKFDFILSFVERIRSVKKLVDIDSFNLSKLIMTSLLNTNPFFNRFEVYSSVSKRSEIVIINDNEFAFPVVIFTDVNQRLNYAVTIRKENLINNCLFDKELTKFNLDFVDYDDFTDAFDLHMILGDYKEIWFDDELWYSKRVYINDSLNEESQISDELMSSTLQLVEQIEKEIERAQLMVKAAINEALIEINKKKGATCLSGV